jgi:hypothetical protein
MFLSMDDIEKNIEIAPEEVAAYYKEHIDEYEQPEQRAVLQLVFENEEDATAAAQKLANGIDFMSVAAAAGQTMTDVALGYVARADLADELAEVIFALNKGQTSEVVKIADSWQILRVTDIKAPQKADKAKAEAETAEVDTMKNMQEAYDKMCEQVNHYLDEATGRMDEIRADRDRYKKERDELRDRFKRLEDSLLNMRSEYQKEKAETDRKIAQLGRKVEAMRPFLCGDLACKKRQLVALLDGEGNEPPKEPKEIEPLDMQDM